jgi:hypothetical protein
MRFGDRVDPVDGQLAQALKVAALTAEALEQEGGVGDRQLMPPSTAVCGSAVWSCCGSWPGTSFGRYRASRPMAPWADAARQPSGNASA